MDNKQLLNHVLYNGEKVECLCGVKWIEIPSEELSLQLLNEGKFRLKMPSPPDGA